MPLSRDIRHVRPQDDTSADASPGSCSPPSSDVSSPDPRERADIREWLPARPSAQSAPDTNRSEPLPPALPLLPPSLNWPPPAASAGGVATHRQCSLPWTGPLVSASAQDVRSWSAAPRDADPSRLPSQLWATTTRAASAPERSDLLASIQVGAGHAISLV